MDIAQSRSTEKSTEAHNAMMAEMDELQKRADALRVKLQELQNQKKRFLEEDVSEEQMKSIEDAASMLLTEHLQLDCMILSLRFKYAYP